MDISTIVPTERSIELHHPGDPSKLIGIRVSVMSINDPRMRTIKRRIQDQKLRFESRGKHFKATDIEKNVNDTIFSAMTGWEWYGKKVSFHGEKPAFNKENVTRVLTELEWVADQLVAAIGDEQDFFTTSNPT